MPILCEELMCLQIATTRFTLQKGVSAGGVHLDSDRPQEYFTPAFFTTVAPSLVGGVPSRAEGLLASSPPALSSQPLMATPPARSDAKDLQQTWHRVCKEVVLTRRLEEFEERNGVLPSAFLDGLPMSTKLVATKAAKRLGILSGQAAIRSHVSGAGATVQRRPKHVVFSSLVDEFRNAWQQHQEAQLRARLKALKDNDADAYMEFLHHTKITSLLHIMELTHNFMLSIGAQLEKQQGDGGSTVAAHQQPRTVTMSDEYNRFKEYVASTKDEYKLVHRSAVYVERQPVGLHATLMPHQLVGLRFLASLHANNINGILADEMGVGKTIQTLAFLLCLKEGGSGAPTFGGPHLVLAPLSIIREWSEACDQFVRGSMKYGEFGDIVDSGERLDSYDLVFLAAHRVRNVTSALSAVRWGYIVVDEAHKAVSNLKTITAQAICAIPYKHRLVLTGTPLNSDLQELWSLLNFINPKIFKDLNSFDDVFRKPFQAVGAGDGHEGAQLNDEERALLVMRLHQVIRPFMLRRTKRDIDQTLQITYHDIYCPITFPQELFLSTLRNEKQLPCVLEGRCVHRSVLTVEQAAQSLCNHAFMIPFLSQVLERYRLSRLSLLDAVKPMPNTPLATDVAIITTSAPLPLLESPNTSCDEATQPDAPNSTVAGSFGGPELDESRRPAFSAEPSQEALMSLGCSGKLLVLDLILRRARTAGVKAVIFTHWLDCIDLLTEYFEGALGWEANREYVALTGSSTSDERKACVERFRHDAACGVFLVSMKAGGCGLNLQVTHLIIMLDRDYTGTNEEQAIARVFRIGQKNIVRALYLLTKDPSEQRILDIAAKKDKPRHAIIEGGGYHVEAVTDSERREVLDRATGSGPADVIDVSTLDLITMTGSKVFDAMIVPTCAISSEMESRATITEATAAILLADKTDFRPGYYSRESMPEVFRTALDECDADRQQKNHLDDLGRGKRCRSGFNEDDIVPDWFWDKLTEAGVEDCDIEDQWKAKRQKERDMAELSSVSFVAACGAKMQEHSLTYSETTSKYRRMPCAGVLTS